MGTAFVAAMAVVLLQTGVMAAGDDQTARAEIAALAALARAREETYPATGRGKMTVRSEADLGLGGGAVAAEATVTFTFSGDRVRYDRSAQDDGPLAEVTLITDGRRTLAVRQARREAVLSSGAAGVYGRHGYDPRVSTYDAPLKLRLSTVLEALSKSPKSVRIEKLPDEEVRIVAGDLKRAGMTVHLSLNGSLRLLEMVSVNPTSRNSPYVVEERAKNTWSQLSDGTFYIKTSDFHVAGWQFTAMDGTALGEPVRSRTDSQIRVEEVELDVEIDDSVFDFGAIPSDYRVIDQIHGTIIREHNVLDAASLDDAMLALDDESLRTDSTDTPDPTGTGIGEGAGAGPSEGGASARSRSLMFLFVVGGVCVLSVLLACVLRRRTKGSEAGTGT